MNNAMEIIRDKVLEGSYMIITICNMMERGDLRIDYKGQRNPDTWTPEDRDGYIASMIKGEDCDSIKICEQIKKNSVCLWVIDGGHRVTNIENFIKGAFALGKNIERSVVSYQVYERDNEGNLLVDENGERITRIASFDLRGKRYSDLPPELKERFDNKGIGYVKHLNCTDSDIAYHIRRYNKQKTMNPAEVAVTYMTGKAGYLKNITKKNRFFKDCGVYTSKDRTNGNLERIAIETIMCTNHLEFWKSGSKDNAKYIENNSSKEEFAVLEKNLNRLRPIVSEKHDELFTTKNSFIFITLFNRFLELGIEEERFGDFLAEFKVSLKDVKFPEYEDMSFVEFDKAKGTKDKKTVITKLEMLEKLMTEFLHINKEETVTETENNITEDTAEVAGSQEAEELTAEDNGTDTESLENFIADCIGESAEDIKNDLDFYEEMLDILLENTVRLDSKLRNDENRKSLLAMVAYSCKEETDLDTWMEDYAKKTFLYFKDQKKNYIKMLEDFTAYISDKEVKTA